MIEKIMFHINSLGYGGAERVVLNLAKHFSLRGINVLIATEWEANEEYDCPVNVKRIHVGLEENEENKSNSAKRKIRKNRLHQLINKEQPDVVLSFCRNANFRAILAAQGTKVPVIFSVRNDPKTDYASLKNNILGKMLYKRALGGVFQTEEAADFFSTSIKKKSKVILNPLNEKYLSIEPASSRKKTIVTVGRLTSAKDQIVLIKAFEMLSKDYPEYELHIYGEPSEDRTIDMLTTYISEHNLSKQVILKGVSNQLEKDIIDAGMFVLPSRYEGMPNALMEAMAMGLPVISTDCPCGGPATIIRNNENGILVPVGDITAMSEAIRYYIDNPDKAQLYGEKALEIVKEANPTVVADTWLQYIEKRLNMI